MKKVTVQVEDYLYDFYRKVGQQAGGIAGEKVMADALFKLTGELSLHALGKQKKMWQKKRTAIGRFSCYIQILFADRRHAAVVAQLCWDDGATGVAGDIGDFTQKRFRKTYAGLDAG